MKPIESHEIKESRRKRNSFVVGVVLIGILILSTVGFGLADNFSSNSENIDVVSDKLTYNGQYWTIQKYGNDLYFTYSKDEVNSTAVNINYKLSDISNSDIYIDTGKDEYSFNELASNLGSFAKKLQRACYGSCSLNLPEKDCNGSHILIVVNYSLDNSARQDKSCIFVDGDLRSTDALLYKLFEI